MPVNIQVLILLLILLFPLVPYLLEPLLPLILVQYFVIHLSSFVAVGDAVLHRYFLFRLVFWFLLISVVWLSRRVLVDVGVKRRARLFEYFRLLQRGDPVAILF